MWKLAFAFLAVLLAVGFGQNPDGGTDANANDPEVQAALKSAMDEYNRASPDIYLYKVVKVIRAQITPWEGYKCTVTVMIARTVCKKGRLADWCPVFIRPHQAKSYRCTFVVRYNEWVGLWMLVEQECH